MFRSILACLGCLLVLVGCLGCSSKPSDRPETLPATAIVTLDGTPVEGATVTFHGGTNQRGATGRTDAQGVAKMMTFEPGDGAIPGKYKVTIQKIEGPALTTDVKNDAPPPRPDLAPPVPIKHLVPEKYATPTTTDLTAEVAKGSKNEFTFSLNK